ncbi:MAG: translocated intimin receptor Tir [Verrucomicrobia bacterium]|nr:MAG: translocated intimin receptor Tir [Verrucomicrobiota bacterium]PYJ93721.1 MAG: translocated intimin receptor Tir [Verrucomicrobiota bacterium]PYL79475.1 MAG: translocated intimin receptor Tir [Verrucomicrobiota bacterium]
MNDKHLRIRPDSLFSTIMRDIHFWIPLLVLLAGLLFLRELR